MVSLFFVSWFTVQTWAIALWSCGKTIVSFENVCKQLQSQPRGRVVLLAGWETGPPGGLDLHVETKLAIFPLTRQMKERKAERWQEELFCRSTERRLCIRNRYVSGRKIFNCFEHVCWLKTHCVVIVSWFLDFHNNVCIVIATFYCLHDNCVSRALSCCSLCCFSPKIVSVKQNRLDGKECHTWPKKAKTIFLFSFLLVFYLFIYFFLHFSFFFFCSFCFLHFSFFLFFFAFFGTSLFFLFFEASCVCDSSHFPLANAAVFQKML